MRVATRAVIAWFGCLLLSGLAVAVCASVTSELTVHKVVKDKDGRETLVPAETAKPGDVLQYTITYRNTGSAPVTSLTNTLPIPTPMEFLPGTDQPKAASASTDGRAFFPIPLMRQSKADADKLEPVPYAEYRFLRWYAPKLEPKQSLRYSARVRVLAKVTVIEATSAAIPKGSASGGAATNRRRP